MIRALISGQLFADPISRTTATGNQYATARISVPQGDEGRISCSLIAFEDAAVKRLLQLRSGASIAAAGSLRVTTWTDRTGKIQPSLDLQADEIASTTPRPKEPREPRAARTARARPSEPHSEASSGLGGQVDDQFADLPGCGDLPAPDARFTQESMPASAAKAERRIRVPRRLEP